MDVSIQLPCGNALLVDSEAWDSPLSYFSRKYGHLGTFVPSRLRWHVVKPSQYVLASFGTGQKNRDILIHRLVTECPQSHIVDHRFGNRLDNRRSQLRICTNTENGRNYISAKKRSKSGYIGVQKCHRCTTNPWYGQVGTRISGKWFKTRTGQFATAEEAAEARDVMASTMFGEFAVRNFPTVTRLNIEVVAALEAKATAYMNGTAAEMTLDYSRRRFTNRRFLPGATP